MVSRVGARLLIVVDGSEYRRKEGRYVGRGHVQAFGQSDRSGAVGGGGADERWGDLHP